MSEILSKSMHMPGGGTSPSALAKTETNGDELIFAALFGGATGHISADDDNGDAEVFTVQTTEQEDLTNPLQDESIAIISALQAAKDFDQKQAGKANDAALKNSELASGGENSDALTDIIAAVPLGAHVDPVSGDLAKGTIADLLQNINSNRANMSFDNGKLSGHAIANLPKLGFGPNPGQITPNAIIKPVGEGQAAPSETFIGPMPALSADAKMATKIANFRATRAANLEQRNAEINAKLSGDDGDFIGKLDRAITTAANLKQTFMSDSSMAMGDKVLARATPGLDMARPSHASAASVDSVSGASAQSLNNQTGGQTGGQAGGQTGGQAGGQSGGQVGAASGGGLLNNLNMLQTIDMAKNNWTEMLLQRVQKGLAGGKDQLNFQLNPRNLGKMQISLVIQNDRTNILIQTETSAAASMLSDSEARLAQMLETSGLRLGNLNSSQSQGFGGNKSGGHADQQNQAETSGKTIAGNAVDDGNSEDAITERLDGLINIQA
jgi:flagellar hook-length control protein FliK